MTWAVDRLRPVAPPAAWSGIVAARSLVGSGPLVLAPSADRVLVIAPHPDDETIGCGGTLAGLARRAAEVRVLVATAGEASVAALGAGTAATAISRRSEVSAACTELGIGQPSCLELTDGSLADELGALSSRIAELLASFEPDAIFVPWPLDGHVDHRAAALAVAAVELPAHVEIWGYEVWSALPANRLVDIGASWEAKQRALARHESAHGTFDPAAHLALARWRSIFGLDGHGHAEAFLVLDGPRWRALCLQDAAP